MNKELKAFVESTTLFGFVGAVFFALVFAQLNLSGDVVGDLIFGVLSGIIAGVLVSIVVGVAERQLSGQCPLTDLVPWAICDAFVGMLAGAVIATYVVIVLVQITGYNIQPPGAAVWGVLLGRFIGFPLGVLLGFVTGVSWRWLQVRLVGKHGNAAI